MASRAPEGCGGARPDAAAAALAEAPPDWLATLPLAECTRIDVRPILTAGSEPFDEIMALARRTAVGEGLIVVAPFHPLPLRRVLAEEGFETFAERLGERHWQLSCLRRRPTAALSPPTPLPGGGSLWREGKEVHIDVRRLPPPAPLVAILRLIQTQGHDGVIIAHLDRDPIHLYPELAELGWSATPLTGEGDEVRLRLAASEE